MKMRSAAVLLTATLVGCTLTNPMLRKDSEIPVIGGHEVLAPKRTVLRVMVARRPQGESALATALWDVADEQTIDADTRRALQTNGLRVGVVSGDLPAEVQAVLSAPPPDHVDAQTIMLPDGDQTLLDPATPPRPTLNLFVGQNDKLVGKDFQDPRGVVRVTVNYQGEDAVTLRFTPEIQHGPVQQGWGVSQGGTPMSPKQIVAKSGQAEEAFRDLGCTLTLKPGQVAVLGGRFERKGSLGDFLFGEPATNGESPKEKVIFLWAGRSDQGTPEGEPPSGLVPLELPIEGTP